MEARYCICPRHRQSGSGILLYVFLLQLFLLIIPAGGGAELVDRIAAIVNDDIILESELDSQLQPIVMRIQSSAYSNQKKKEMINRFREDLLNQMIEEKLTKQEIASKKISVSEKEIDNAIEKIKRDNYYTEKDLRAVIFSQGMDMAAYRARIKEQILQSKLVNLEIKSKIVITPADIQAYYENNKNQFKGEKKYHLRNLMMPISSFASEKERANAKKRMDVILNQIRRNQPFDKTDTVGRDLGFIGEKKLSPQLQKALGTLNRRDFTEVLDTDQGMQIFYIQDIQTEAGKTLADASAEIERILYNKIVKDRFQNWIETLRKSAHIKILR